MQERGALGVFSAGLALCVVAYVVLAIGSVPTLVDDAWISARYALLASTGEGLAYNTGDPPIEGYTNLGWTLLLILPHRFGWPLADTMAWGGFGLGLGGLFTAFALAAALARRWHPGLLVAPMVLALDPHYAVACSNGLETALALFGLPAATTGWLIARGHWRWLAGAAVGATALVRPEAAALVLALSVSAVARERSRAALPLVLPAVGSLVGVTVWRWVTYGALVPNTFAAKANSRVVNQISNNLSNYFAPEPAYWAGFLTIAVGSFVLARQVQGRWAVGVAAAAIIGSAISVELWMPGGRLLLPAASLCIALLASVTDRSDAARWLAGMVIAGQLLLLVSPVRDRVYRYDQNHSALPGNGAERAARHLAEHIPAGAWVAIRDAGVFAYHLGPKVRVGELHGRALTRPHPGGAATDLSFLPRNPAVVVTTVARIEASDLRYTNDRAVFEQLTRRYRYLGRVHQHFHRFYDVYVRADMDVPPFPEGLPVNFKGPQPPFPAL
ncbi:MAG: arabinofuranosyltransferase [Myxococcota bacterium]|jgi:arabinofuranosyltransferase